VEKIGITIPEGLGIGDKVQFCHIPENFYKNYGVKLIDVSNCWVFDKNPYIERGVNPDKVLDLWSLPYNNGDYLNRVEFFNSVLKFSKIYCRSTRLYKYEDPSNVIHNKVCIHAQGKSSGHTLSKEIIEKIKERYSKYDIYQIGGQQDIDCGLIDCRGSSMWETVKHIATSAIFIGVNSGPMNIANCYPHINKKLILLTEKGHHNVSVEELEKNAAPLWSGNHYFNWVDYGWQYYNDTAIDIGITYTYNKI